MLFGAWISHGCVAEYPEYCALAQLFDFALGLCSLQAEEAESVSETAEAETVQAGGLFCSRKGFGAVFRLPKLWVFHTNRSLPHLTDSIRSTHLIPGHSPPPAVLHLTLCSLDFQLHWLSRLPMSLLPLFLPNFLFTNPREFKFGRFAMAF